MLESPHADLRIRGTTSPDLRRDEPVLIKPVRGSDQASVSIGPKSSLFVLLEAWGSSSMYKRKLQNEATRIRSLHPHCVRLTSLILSPIILVYPTRIAVRSRRDIQACSPNSIPCLNGRWAAPSALRSPLMGQIRLRPR